MVNNKWNSYLKELIDFSINIESLTQNLSSIDWDYEPKKPIYLKISDIQSVLERYYIGEVSIKELIDWANLIEGRESLTYLEDESNKINDLIFYIANPEINYSLDKNVINKILLSKQ